MIPSGYSRNVISGHLPGGEIFQTSFWCNEAPSDQGATQSQADNFRSELDTQLNGQAGNPYTFMATGGGYDKITTYSYLDTSGRATYVAESALTFVGTGSSQGLPDQCALVATLQTGNAGRRNRGRMYWPFLTNLGSGGQVTSSTVDSFAQWLATLIGKWNSHLGDQRVCVLSQVGGTAHPVTAVKVDTKIDIQRRRANSVIPAHQMTANV